jgi:hypothetical protein
VRCGLLLIVSLTSALAMTPHPDGESNAGKRGRSWWVSTETRSPQRPALRVHGETRTASASPPCTYIPANPPKGQEARKGKWYIKFCKPFESFFGFNTNAEMVFVPQGQAAPTVTPYELALQALRQLRPPAPQIRTAPPRGAEGMVGLRHYFWADRQQWRVLTRRAQAGAVWAEVTATPSRFVIEPGSGQPRTSCSGPGTPYRSDRPGACTVLFSRSSAGLPGSHYQVTVSVVWTARWTGSGGTGGTLAPITTSTTFPLRVAEGQALIRRSS